MIVLLFLVLTLSVMPAGAAPVLERGGAVADAISLDKRLDQLHLEKHVRVVSIEYIGTVDGIREDRIKLDYPKEKFGNLTLTAFYIPDGKELKRNHLILPGESLVGHVLYAPMARYFVESGNVVYTLDRGEADIPLGLDSFGFMRFWDIRHARQDAYSEVVTSRIYTHYLNSKNHYAPAKKIKVTAFGHSMGGYILTDYLASSYNKKTLGQIDGAIVCDIVIKYKPDQAERIDAQKQAYGFYSGQIKNKIYQNEDMKNMLGALYLSAVDPSGNSPIMPGKTNVAVFRLLASGTANYISNPPSSDYCYWVGDENGLVFVDEAKLTATVLGGGAVPYAPIAMDRDLAGIEGNVPGYEVDASKISCPILYFGLGRGFGSDGSWWFTDVVGKTNHKVKSILWQQQGHGSIVMDKNAPEGWDQMKAWMKSN